MRYDTQKRNEMSRGRHVLNQSVIDAMIYYNFFVAFLYCIFCIPVIFTHILPGMLIYFWFPIILLCPFLLCFPLLISGDAKSDDCLHMMMEFCFYGCMAMIYIPVAFLLGVVSFSVTFGMVGEFYHGMAYGDSITQVWTERKIGSYFDDLGDDILLMMRMFI